MYPDHVAKSTAGPLAAALLAGAWTETAMLDRARRAFDPRPLALSRVVRQTLEAYHHPPHDRPRELERFLAALLSRPMAVIASQPVTPRVRRMYIAPERMADRRPWPVPELHVPGDVARLLDLHAGDLDWLADPKRLEARVRDAKLRNYRYTWVQRAQPVAPPRLIEQPKPRLKRAQRIVLRSVLDWIPVHDAAHGFVRGRSAVTHASAHTGRAVVVRFDLEDFFAGVEAGRVYGIFRTAGYAESVSHLLAALCTNVLPHDEWAAVKRPREQWAITAHHRLGRRLATPHLPQGAPTSPALANLAAYKLDVRLAGLGASLGAAYTRYADDLAFSGDAQLIGRAATLRAAVTDIARDEGFVLNERKTALSTRAGRQRVTGIVVNDRLNVARPDYDRLKAVIHNARRDGAGAVDRAELRGQIAWVAQLNPRRGERLLAGFEQIDWSGK